MDLKDAALNILENAVKKQVEAKFQPAVDSALLKLEEKLGTKYGLAVEVVKEIVNEVRADAEAELLKLVDKIDGQVG